MRKSNARAHECYNNSMERFTGKDVRELTKALRPSEKRRLEKASQTKADRIDKFITASHDVMAGWGNQDIYVEITQGPEPVRLLVNKRTTARWQGIMAAQMQYSDFTSEE
jgi:hypothetical protein